MGILMHQRAAGATEKMDLPDCDPRLLENTYRKSIPELAGYLSNSSFNSAFI